MDTSPAEWIGSGLHPSATDVGSIIPEGFEAYGRLFHPVEGDAGRRERWGDLARRNRRMFIPRCSSIGSAAVEWHEPGTLAALRARIQRRRPRRRVPSLPLVDLPHRRYYLYRGSIQKALGPLPLEQSPNLWWPEDRAWFVATEIDYAWTYVGGPRRAVEELVEDGRVEVLLAELTDLPFYDSDVRNEALESD